MSITKRFEPQSDDIMEIICVYEMLRLNCYSLLDIAKRAAKKGCDVIPDNCLACDALKLLRELGEAE